RHGWGGHAEKTGGGVEGVAPREPPPLFPPSLVKPAGPWLPAVPGATRWPAAGRFPATLDAASWPDQGNWTPPITPSSAAQFRLETRGLTPFHALTIGPPACEAADGRARRGAQARSGKRFKKTRFLNVTAVRTHRQKCAGWAQGQPLQHQDQAAFPAQSAQRHHDIGRARPLGQAARVGKRAQDRRSPRRPGCISVEGEGRRPVREGARIKAPDQEEKGGGSGVSATSMPATYSPAFGGKCGKCRGGRITAPPA